MVTHVEPDILECEAKWALGNINTNKASKSDGIPPEIFKILKDAAVKVLHSVSQQIWKSAPERPLGPTARPGRAAFQTSFPPYLPMVGGEVHEPGQVRRDHRAALGTHHVNDPSAG